MSKIIVKTGMLSGAIAGFCTLIFVNVIHVVRAYHDNIYYLIIVFIGDLIRYSLLAIFGGAITGIILGALGSFIVSAISGGRMEARIGALSGGILVGLLPLWMGFGYLY